MALSKKHFADHLKKQAIISLAKKQKTEISEVTFEATQELRDALIYIFPIHGNYSLKLINPRASLQSNFYTKEKDTVIDYFSGGSGGYNHFSNILTTKLDETGKCLFEHVADNDNVTPIALEVFQEVFGFSDDEIAQIKSDVKAVCDRLHDLDMGSNPFKQGQKSQNNHNVPQTIIKDGDDSIIVTPIHSLKRHMDIYNVLHRDTAIYPITAKIITAALKEWKNISSADLQKALGDLQIEVTTELSKLEYTHSEHEALMDYVAVCFAKCEGLVNTPKKVHALLNDLSSEINSKYKLFGNVLESFEISNQIQNVSTQLPRHKYSVKVKSQIPSIHSAQQYRKAQKLRIFIETNDYKKYPIWSDEKLQRSLESLFAMRNIGATRQLRKHEENTLSNIARSCRYQIDQLISQVEVNLANYKAENDIKSSHKRPKMGVIIPLLHVSDPDGRAFLKTAKCRELIELGRLS